MESTGPEPDFTVKYQKLATEYSKLRTISSVLKKAVADEQSKCAELRETLKEKDQVTRKLEQEIECLNFRNVQLSKRVKILQDDLQIGKDKSKKNKNKTPAALPAETQNILDAELSSRIEENEKLHQQVYSAEIEHKRMVDEMTENLEKLQMETVRQQEILNQTVAKQDSVIKKLTEERAKMEVKIKNLEKELEEVHELERNGIEEMKKTEDELQAKLKNSCYQNQLNKYTIQLLVRKHWDLLIHLLKELGSLLSEFVRKLSDLHAHVEQQVHLNVDSSNTNSKLLQHLGEHSFHLKAINETYQTLVTKSSSNVSAIWAEGFQFTPFADAIKSYIQYLEKLFPYIILFLESKANNSNTTRVADAFQMLQIVARKLVNAFCIFSNWLSILVNGNNLSDAYGLQLSLEVIIRNVLCSAQRLLDCLKEMRQHTSTKIAVESQLLTVTTEMRTTDECILSCLVSLFNIMEKMLKLVKDNGAIFENGSVGNPTCNSTVVMKEFGAKNIYLSHNNEESSPYIYSLAPGNQKSIGNFQDVQETMQQKFALLEAKFSKMEQEKEHWLLEYQLLQAKQKREITRTTSPGENQDYVSTQDMEACVKAHIHKLLGRLQVADSKAVTFEGEFQASCQTLRILESEHESTKGELDETIMHLELLKETHQATVNNYEDQLATMSEHLANMNDKLSSQKDEIDSLRQLSGKKSKSK